MSVAIHIPRMLPDNDFHFRLGHAAPTPVTLRTDPLHDVRAVLRQWGARMAVHRPGQDSRVDFLRNPRVSCERGRSIQF